MKLRGVRGVGIFSPLRVQRGCLLASRRVAFSVAQRQKNSRLRDYGRVIEDDFSVIRKDYRPPKHPIILAHGLFGFEVLHLAGPYLPGVQYWRGITEALAEKDVEVITAEVPPAGSVETRATSLARVIEDKAKGKSVNIIAFVTPSSHLSESFADTATDIVWYCRPPSHINRLENANILKGGLDSRYMISQLKPPHVKVLSLTTIATPHRGSAFADYIFERVGPVYTPRIYKVLESFGLETGAFSQLTRQYMENTFNPKTPDVEGVKYYSYGASLEPQRWSIFRPSHDIIKRIEGAANDGLVSVPSSMWGSYRGTLLGVSHLDLINWTNRLKWMAWELMGTKKNFNAVAFYLHIADTLAREGL